MAENIFFEEIGERVLCEAAQSFEDEVLNGVSLSISVHCSVFLLYIIKQMKKPKLCIMLCKMYPGARVFYISLVLWNARLIHDLAGFIQ